MIKQIIVEKFNTNDDTYKVVSILDDMSQVAVGDMLYEIETSKASFEVSAESDGFIKNAPHLKVGDNVNVGELIGVILPSKDSEYEFVKQSPQNKTTTAPANFTKAAFEFVMKNDIDPELFKDHEIVDLETVKAFSKKTESFSCLLNRPKLIIAGAAGHGLELLEIVKRQNIFEFCGFVDIRFPDVKEYAGYKIVGNDDSYKELYSLGIENIVVAAGWLKKPEIIQSIFSKATKANFKFPTIIHPSAVISESAVIGNGVQIFSNVTIGPNAKIEDGVIINNGAVVSHDSIVRNYAFIAPGAIIAGSVEVGEFAVLGINSSVYLRRTIPPYYVLNNNQTF